MEGPGLAYNPSTGAATTTNSLSTGSQTGAVYDPATGMIYNPASGAAVGPQGTITPALQAMLLQLQMAGVDTSGMTVPQLQAMLSQQEATAAAGGGAYSTPEGGVGDYSD
jgi:hypothetical protein